MILWTNLRQAWFGWLDIVRLRDSWQTRFGLSYNGLAKALVTFFLFAFAAIAIGSAQAGITTWAGLIDNLMVQALGVIALVIGIMATKLAVNSDVPLLRVLVPGIYGLVFYLIAGSILAAISVDTVAVALLGLVFLLYSLGRVAGGWTLGVSLAFGVLSVVLLVAMPMTLYILRTPAASPI